jgi:hypothetical protein
MVREKYRIVAAGCTVSVQQDVICTLRKSILEQITKPSDTQARSSSKHKDDFYETRRFASTINVFMSHKY